MGKIAFSWKAEGKVFQYFHAGMVSLFLLLVTFMISQMGENKGIFIIGSFLFLAITVARHFSSVSEATVWYSILPYIEGGLLYAMTAFGGGAFGLSLILLLIWDVVIDYNTKYAMVFSLVGFTLYMFTYVASFPDLPVMGVIHLIAIGMFQIAIYVGSAFLAKNYYRQSKELRKATAELNVKMIAMEEMAIIKERNRIALEIHNTVGHQLTTALVQIEATKMLIDREPGEVKSRLEIIKEQVRNGLQEIRQAIHAINGERQYDNLFGSVQRIVGQLRANTAIDVTCEMDQIPETEVGLGKSLYHIILETITNAIRHGHCRAIQITLKNEGNLLKLSIFNDGIIPKDMTFGYGLKKIKEEINSYEGSLVMKINEAGWYGLEIQLPIYDQGGVLNSENKNYVS